MQSGPERFRAHALDILSFWRQHAIDREFGGFRCQLDRTGNVSSDAEKHLVGSTRVIYNFSQGMLLDGPAWCEDLARHGVDFLLRHFWDAEHEGWYWVLSRDGSVREDAKRTYGHAFALLALTEFHRATGDPEALRMALRTFDLLDQHLWDRDLGGYHEGCDRTWSRVDPPWRGQNCNMHALEATLALHEVTGSARHRQRIGDLCHLMEERLFDHQRGCIHEDFHPDWTIDRQRRGDRISIGHQFEWAWLLMQAEAVVPGAFDPVLIDRLMDFAVRCGWDETHGGVYTYVTERGEVVNDPKGFWENSEALMALLWYSRRTGERRRLDLFERQAAFCFTHLADHEHPGWFTTVARDGTPIDTHKGNSWKADYHVVKMCAEVYRYLS